MCPKIRRASCDVSWSINSASRALGAPDAPGARKYVGSRLHARPSAHFADRSLRGLPCHVCDAGRKTFSPSTRCFFDAKIQINGKRGTTAAFAPGTSIFAYTYNCNFSKRRSCRSEEPAWRSNFGFWHLLSQTRSQGPVPKFS
jgi:hypothetical protein